MELYEYIAALFKPFKEKAYTISFDDDVDLLLGLKELHKILIDSGCSLSFPASALIDIKSDKDKYKIMNWVKYPMSGYHYSRGNDHIMSDEECEASSNRIGINTRHFLFKIELSTLQIFDLFDIQTSRESKINRIV